MLGLAFEVKMLEPLFPELDSCDHLFLTEIREDARQSLFLLIEEGRASSESTPVYVGDTRIGDGHPIRSTGRQIELVWDWYIAYCVRNESYCGANGDEATAVGKKLRIYSKSDFLDYLSRATFATAEYPGPFLHYCLISENHIVDVASVKAPNIRLR